MPHCYTRSSSSHAARGAGWPPRVGLPSGVQHGRSDLPCQPVCVVGYALCGQRCRRQIADEPNVRLCHVDGPRLRVWPDRSEAWPCTTSHEHRGEHQGPPSAKPFVTPTPLPLCPAAPLRGYAATRLRRRSSLFLPQPPPSSRSFSDLFSSSPPIAIHNVHFRSGAKVVGTKAEVQPWLKQM